MEISQKSKKILIGAGVLVALAVIGASMTGSRKNAEVKSPTSMPEENKSLPADNNEQMPSLNADDNQTDTTPAKEESTPEERANRTVSPSDAASYSEEDLPSDFNGSSTGAGASTGD